MFKIPPPLDPILNEFNPIHDLTSYFSKIQLYVPIYIRVSKLLSSLKIFRLKLCIYLSMRVIVLPVSPSLI
jgi:hypothetical protein